MFLVFLFYFFTTFIYGSNSLWNTNSKHRRPQELSNHVTQSDATKIRKLHSAISITRVHSPIQNHFILYCETHSEKLVQICRTLQFFTNLKDLLELTLSTFNYISEVQIEIRGNQTWLSSVYKPNKIHGSIGRFFSLHWGKLFRS